MFRFVGIGMAILALVVASFLLLPHRHSDGTRSAMPPSSKRPRTFSVPTHPVVSKGFTGVMPPLEVPNDRKANILHLLADGETLHAQTAISEWYTADPVAAEEWLESQPSWAEYQPAISLIAKQIAESGYPVEALEWAKLLEAGENREGTIYEIYATGRRYNWLTDDQIRTAPFPPKKIEDLLSGASDD